MASILIQGGRLIDPSTGEDRIGDLYIHDGCIAPLPRLVPAEASIVKAQGLTVVPGFIDLHVHLREPGGEAAETILTGSQAAARGGFVTVVAMPNTQPPLDTPERVAWVKEQGDKVGLINVLPSGCLTRNRDGFEPADLAGMAAAGAAAFTDDGTTVADENTLREVMRQAAKLDRVVMDHAHDRELEKKGVMHEGAYSRRHGLPGIPSIAESRVVERDIAMAAETGCRLHIQHVSARESVEAIRKAIRAGLRVSGELTPHHLALTDADVDPQDARYKMNPPLRSEEDRQSLIEAIVDGTLEVFATDHAPHTKEAKAKGFLLAPFGIVGLETAIGVTFTALVASGRMDLLTWVRRWTTGPARILGLPAPSLRPGAPAHITLLDLETAWVVDPAQFASRSRNTPFEGKKLVGKAVRIWTSGREFTRAT
ncbi:MAG TPA: dihydroorotase [Verrucomicrobia bacterium]|nr:MAG: hypothetical protein A2X46_12045 [Lentisphaerae bacterium GWF2_57_35]HBA85234.1 dihydroorotase [Verrucomicrobiota bacterium]